VTTNSWSTSTAFQFNPGSDVLPFTPDFQLDPSNPDIGYFGTNFLWRFIKIPFSGIYVPRLGNVSLASGGGTITSISICESDPNTIYTGSSTGDVFVTHDAGATWRDISAGLPNAAVSDVSVHPSDNKDLLVAFSGTGTGHVYHCEHTGAANLNWVDVTGSGLLALPDVSANTIIRSIYDPEDTWWVGNDVGAFLTSSSGAAWLNINPLGLPNVQVNDLTFTSGSSHIFAATYGRGIWRIEIFPPNSSVSSASAPSSATAGQPIPIQIILDHIAPDSGTRVNLSSNSPAVVVPAQAYVPFNTDRTTVNATSRTVSLSPVAATVTVQLLNSIKTVPITINPPSGLFGVEVFSVAAGELFDGGLADFNAADESVVSIFNDPSTLAGRIEMRGTSPIAAPAGLSVQWVSGVGRPGLSETLEIFNVSTLQWVSASGRSASTGLTYFNVASVANPTQYVGPNQRVRSALEWNPINDEDPSQDGWLQSIDFFAWRVQ
jgi:hypothetical protein